MFNLLPVIYQALHVLVSITLITGSVAPAFIAPLQTPSVAQTETGSPIVSSWGQSLEIGAEADWVALTEAGESVNWQTGAGWDEGVSHNEGAVVYGPILPVRETDGTKQSAPVPLQGEHPGNSSGTPAASPRVTAVVQNNVTQLNRAPENTTDGLHLFPQQMTARQLPGSSLTQTLTLINNSPMTITWGVSAVLTDTGSIITSTNTVAGSLWQQPASASAGRTASYSNDSGTGLYQAASFALPTYSEIDVIFVDGFFTGNGLADATAFSWHIYEDLEGQPAGHPEDGLGTAVWQFTATAPLTSSLGLTLTNESLTLDLAEAGVATPELASGRYWLVAYAHMNNYGENNQWAWQETAVPGGLQIAPGNLNNQPAGWHTTSSSRAFALQGRTYCGSQTEADWLALSASSGQLPPQGQTDLIVTYSSTALTEGTYQGHLCVTSDLSETPFQFINLTHHVYSGPIVNLSPANITATMTAGDAITRTITISNSGDSDLLFQVNPIHISGQRQLRVAILGADYDAPNITDLISHLAATNRFTQVDFINISETTPTLAELQQYDALLVYSWYSLFDEVGLGNVVADYVDAGGGVLVMYYAFMSWGRLEGRFLDEGYYAIDTNANSWVWDAAPVDIGLVNDLDHPVLRDVTQFQPSYEIGTAPVLSDTQIVAYYTNGYPMLVERAAPSTQAPRIDLNSFPISSNVDYWYWQAGSDGARLMANALDYVALADYISSSGQAGTVSAGSSVDLTLTIDSSSLISGTYAALLRVSSNDPVVAQAELPITLTVTGTPSLTLPAQAVDMGTIFVGQSSSYTAVITNSGTADLVIGSISSSHSEVSAAYAPEPIPPYQSRPITITFAPQISGTTNATLDVVTNGGSGQILANGQGLLPPVITTSPTAITAVLAANTVISRTFTVGNVGNSDLLFNLLAVNNSGSLTEHHYFWQDSNQPGGPTYTWQDIAATGTQVTGLFDDGFVGPFPIGFDFTFFGESFDQFYVTDNGYIGFGPPDNYGSRFVQPIPTASTPNNMIAWFWDDLVPQYDSAVYYQQTAAGLIIQFDLYGRYGYGSARINAQLLLTPRHEIYIHYADIIGDWPVANGAIGVENADGTEGVQVAYQEAYIEPELTVYIADRPVWLTIAPTSGVVPVSATQNVTLTIDSTGLISGTYEATLLTSSNDPDDSLRQTPLTVTVTGTPALTTTTTAVDFGSVYVGVTATKGITLSSIGTAEARVTAVASDHPDLTAHLTSTLLMPVGQNQMLPLSYHPSSATPLTATVTITSDGGVLTVPVSGLVLWPPQIAVSPTALLANLDTGQVVTRQFTINNAGTGDLLYEVEKMAGIGYLNVAVLGAETTTSYANDVVNKLTATGLFHSVTFINAATGTPSLETLQAYDAVLVFRRSSFNNRTLLGDALADYMDSGGGVVMMHFALYNSGYLLGRFHANGYHAIDPVNSSYQSLSGSYLGLGQIHDPDHPVLDQVSTFDGGYYSYHSSGALTNGAVVLAEYSNGRPLVVEKSVTTPAGEARRIDLNFVPISSSAAFGYWDAGSDGALLMANALRYVAQPNFVAVNPATGLIAPGSSRALTVTLDATDLVSGTYPATLNIYHNDPFTETVALPVTLFVNGTAVLTTTPSSLDFGNVYVGVSVSETVALGNLGTADLVLTAVSSDHFDISSNFSGPLLVPIGGSQPLAVTYQPASPVPLTATITITSTGGVLTVPVVGNGLLPPIIEVAPGQFDEVVPAGASITRSLTISNSGSDDLTFNLRTSIGGVGPIGDAPRTLLLTNGGNATAARNSLVATGLFSSTDLDILDNPSNLTLAMLQPYDVVLVWTNNAFSNSQTVGNVLKEYVDDGGGVVLATYGLSSSWGIQGGILDAGYSPFLPSTSQSVSGQLDMATLADPQHPIFANLTTPPSYWYNSNYSNPPLNSGGILLAQDTAGNRVVAQNETGKVVGIVIYPGNLGDSNNATSQMFANALYFAFQPVTWFSAAPVSGTVTGGNTETVTLTLDATELISGTYQVDLFVESNDPFLPQVTVPVTMTVIGTPEMVVSPAVLEFGTVFVGATAVQPVVISNTGTADLTLLTASSDHPDTSVNLTNTITLTPGAQQLLTVTYAPSAQAPLSATITFTGTDNTSATLLVTGQGLLPPVVGFAPPAIEETIAAGTSITRSLTISNSGDSPLTYTLVAEHYGGTAVLTLSDDFDPDIDSSQWANLQGATASTNCGSVSGNALYFRNSPRIATTQDLDVTNGGLIEFYLKISRITTPNCEQADSGEEVYLQYSTDAGSTWHTIRAYAVNAYPEFTLIQEVVPEVARSANTRFRWHQPNFSGVTFDHWAIDNIAIFAAGSFVSAQPQNGSILPGQQAQVAILLDATDLISATYQANMLVNSNDPITPQATIPVTLHVTGIPALELVTPDLAMGTAFVGYANTRLLTIANRGTDTLRIHTIASDDPQLAASGLPVTIPPREQRHITVSYLPSAPGLLDANLIVYSNDPAASAQVVPVSGNAIYPPVLTFTPTSFSFSVNTDQVVTQTLLLSNNGLSDLTFGLSTASGHVQLAPITGTIPAGEQQAISATVNGVLFSQGSYNDQIFVTSNDPETPDVAIPVAIQVVLVAPGQPANPNPQDGELNVRIDKTLSWATSSHATSYDLTLWPEGQPRPGTPTVTGLTSPGFNPGALFPTNTRYYWDVLARNNAGVTQGPEWTFVTETLPDLQVTNVTVPPVAFSGQPMELSWIVTNHGDRGTTVSTWYDRVYISTSPTFDLATAIYLGQQANPAFLGLGESYARQASFTLPQGISGNYYAFVVTDATSRMRESEETNNTGASGSTVGVQLTPPPDLQVTAVSIPAAAFAGDTIPVSWVVTNEGTGGTVSTSWYDRLYLSAEPELNIANATLLATLSHSGALAAGQAYTGTHNVTLPHTIFGEYYVFAVTDVYNSVYEYIYEDNNISAAAGPIDISLSAVPDLEVTNLSVPTAVESGSVVNIQWTVTNWGSGPTFETTWRDRIYLSTSPTFTTTGAVVLDTATRYGALGIGDSYTGSRNVTLPNGISGTYYIYLWTDADNQVFEYIFDDNNVIRSEALSVSLAQSPDLIVPEVSTSATAVVGGNPIVVNWTVANQGEATPGSSWQDRVYLSLLPTWNGSGTSLGTFSRPVNLAPGEFYTQTRTVIVPSSLASNDYYIYVMTDVANSVYEHGLENNNVSRAANPVAVTAPSQAAPTDLLIGSVSGPTTGSSGSSIAVSWTVTNTAVHGTVATSWRDGVYLSPDATLNPSTDTLLATSLRSGSLGGGSSYQRTLNVNLPNGIDGDYYLFFRHDVDNQVNDDNRSNNTALLTTPISITLSLSPDLQPTAVAPPANAIAGQPLELTWTVNNQGDTAANGPWYDAVYLSNNATLETSDQRLARRTILGNLAVGSAYTQTATVNIPQSTSGIYYLLVQTDSRDDVYEHEAENNNVVGWPVMVTVPPPADLTVLTVTVPLSAVPGDPITIDWTLQNVGDSPAVGQMCDAVFISGDNTWDVYDAHVGNFCRTINLVPGATEASQLQTLMPSREVLANLTGDLPGVTPGNYYAIVRTDILNNINESDLSNNAGASTDMVLVDVTPLTLGVPVSSTLGTGDGRFYRVDVPAGETLLIALESDNGTAVNELYVSYGQVPSRSNFDYAYSVPLQADQQVVVPTTRQGTYYIALFGASVPGGAQTATLTAELLEFEITSVSPDQIGNIGTATIDIRGAKFATMTTFILTDLDGNLLLEAATLNEKTILNPAVAYANFNTDGMAPGNYLIQAKDGDVFTAPYPIEIVEGGGNLVFNVTAPANARPGQPLTIRISYANNGVSNVEPSLILVRSRNGNVLTTSGPTGESSDSTLALFSMASQGSSGPMMPGSSGQITLQTRATTAVADIEILAIDASSTDPFDWNAFLASGPVDDPTWQEAVATLRARLGESWGEVVGHLSQSARRAGLGIDAVGFNELLTWELFLAYGESTVSHQNGLTSFNDHYTTLPVFDPTGGFNPSQDVTVTPYNSFDPSRPTTVIIHGWNNDANTPWMQDVANAVQTADPNRNIVTVGWGAGADRVFPNDAAYNINAAGQEVANQLQQMGANPSTTDFIGHSFGTYVSNVAAGEMGGANSLVALDPANRFGLNPSNLPDLNFSNNFDYSVSYHTGEIAGTAFTTANESFWVETPYGWWQAGAQHSHAIDFWIEQTLNGGPYGFDRNGPGTELGPGFEGYIDLDGNFYPGNPLNPFDPRHQFWQDLGDWFDDVWDSLRDSWDRFWDFFRYDIPTIFSFDPNDIIGPAGYGDAHWIPSSSVMGYTIRFENDEELATAPAQRVTIAQTLDDDLDMRTFRLGSFGFGDYVFEVPENRSFYQTRIDLVDEIGLFVDFLAGINLVTGELFWQFQSIDPETGAPPVDALAGFLPPNVVEGEGEGFVTYIIRPRSTSATGDVVDAEARIVFDDNDPIDTPPIFNTLDAGRPSSSLDPLPERIIGDEVVLTWSGEDDEGGSGFQTLDLYVSVDGQPFVLAEAGIIESTVVFNGPTGHTYGFYTLARDNAGNQEAPKSTAEVITLLYEAGEPAFVTLEAVPESIIADGASTAVITATVMDGNDVLLPGEVVTFTTSLGTLDVFTGTTTALGVVTATLTAATTPGTAVVTAQSGEISSQLAVELLDRPVAGLTAVNDSPTTLGQTTAFTSTITEGSNVSFLWSFGDGVTTSGITATHQYGQVGVYTAVVTASNPVSSLTATTVVTVTDVPVGGLMASNDGPTELGQTTTLTAVITSGTHVSFTWDLGDGVVASGPVVSHTYGAPGVYTAIVTASNPVSSLTATTVVTVTDVPVGGLMASNDGPTELGQTTTLTAVITSGTHVSFTWDLGDGVVASGPVVSHTYGAPGVYTAVVTASNPTSSLTATTTVTVQETTPLDIPITGLMALSSSPTELGQATLFTATIATGTNVVYAWDFGEGNAGAGAATTHLYNQRGVYTATVTASNAVSTATATIAVVITDPYQLFLPAIINSAPIGVTQMDFVGETAVVRASLSLPSIGNAGREPAR